MSEVKVTQEMVDWCRGLGDGSLDPKLYAVVYRHLCGGICTHFGFKFSATLQVLLGFKTDFPVSPPSDSKVTADIYYYRGVNIRDIEGRFQYYWGDNPYGNARRAFCLKCADELEKLLVEDDTHPGDVTGFLIPQSD